MKMQANAKYGRTPCPTFSNARCRRWTCMGMHGLPQSLHRRESLCLKKNACSSHLPRDRSPSIIPLLLVKRYFLRRDVQAALSRVRERVALISEDLHVILCLQQVALADPMMALTSWSTRSHHHRSHEIYHTWIIKSKKILHALSNHYLSNSFAH